MQNKFTFKKLAVLLRGTFAMICFLLTAASMNAQTVVSTASGTNYLGNYSINNPAPLVQSFAVQNTNATDVVLTSVSMQMAPYFGNSGATDIKLYYSATSLGGPFTAPGPGWTLIGSGSTTVPAALAVIPVITGMNFVIPANTQYRFAIEATKGLAFSFTPTPTPNNFTNGGVTLQVGNFQLGGGNVGYAGLSPTPAVGNTPSFFGGSITVYPATACTGAPAPGATVSSAATACPGVNFNLSTSNPPVPGTTGLTYQWQSGPSATGPWTNIGGATSATLTTNQTAGTYYQLLVTCSGNTVASTPLLVGLTPTSGCYCVAGSTNTSTLFEKIANVKFGTIDNTSTSFGGYTDYTNLTPVANFAAGSTNLLTVTGNANTYAGDLVSVWIDYNRNGSFTDPGEMVFTSAQSAGPYTSNITIPTTATLGTTRMRIRLYDGDFGNGNNTPCGNNTYGEVEDYNINITACIRGTISTQPANATTACGANASFTVAAVGTGLTYQWQERLNATAPWTIINNGGVYGGASTPTLTLTGLPVTYNGRQYQVAIGGGCTPLFLSGVATLSVTPLVATVSTVLPVDMCVTDAPRRIAITNPSGGTTTLSVPSGTLNIPIPDDGTLAGINNTINVTTVPAGVDVTGLSVRLNLTHNWVGDLIIVLKSPTGKVINLAAALGATGGAGGTTGMTNTVISSAGVNPLSGGTNPFTATYRADLRLTPIPSLPPYTNVAPGPPGYVPDTNLWSDLFAGNGNWTLALYDYYEDNLAGNQLINWSINITYGTAATGVFTPSTGLFTDAAGTIPYTGTVINTVYAKPATSTNYTLVVTTPTCVSTALTIPVNVNSPITGTSTVADAAVCVDGTVSLTASTPTSGGTIAHQWKVSTDGGVTYTNVANGGAYSGANTSTLNITGATASMNNYKYKDSLYVTSCNSFTNTNAATLTVNPLPVITLAAAPYTTLYPGITTTITATVAPNAGATYQWFRNGQPVPGATGSSIVVDVDNLGDYSVSVNDVNGCGATSASLTIGSTSNDILFIYPSPTTGQFQVRYYNTPGNSVARTLSIYDSKGSRVFFRTYSVSTPYNQMDVDLKNHGKGIYRVELGDLNGKRIKTGSVLVL